MPSTLQKKEHIESQLTEESIYKPKNDTSSVPFVYLKKFIQATTSRPSTCKECASPVENNCHLIDIPDFKDMVITIDACSNCFYCQYCIKTGDSIAPKGRKTTIVIKKEDMLREVIKSASCVVEIVEIELELTAGTTLFGLLILIIRNTRHTIHYRSKFASYGTTGLG